VDEIPVNGRQAKPGNCKILSGKGGVHFKYVLWAMAVNGIEAVAQDGERLWYTIDTRSWRIFRCKHP
jgi:hypothetical protein